MTKEEHYCDNVNCNHSDTKGLCCLYNPDNCKYRQLQKENAELKEKNNRLTDTVVDLKCKVSEANSNAVIWTEELVAENKYLTKQLTKAKELLKQLVDIEYAINIPKEKIISLRVKAEQFIKDSEVEK